MSVYCGFATRKQEHVYNVVLCKLLKLMSDKLATFMNLTAPNLPIQNQSPQELQKQQEERKWAKKIWKIFKIQGHLERGKHMQPFLSEYIQDFALMLKTQFNFSTNSTHKGSSVGGRSSNQSMSSSTNYEDMFSNMIIEEEDTVEPLDSFNGRNNSGTKRSNYVYPTFHMSASPTRPQVQSHTRFQQSRHSLQTGSNTNKSITVMRTSHSQRRGGGIGNDGEVIFTSADEDSMPVQSSQNGESYGYRNQGRGQRQQQYQTIVTPTGQARTTRPQGSKLIQQFSTINHEQRVLTNYAPQLPLKRRQLLGGVTFINNSMQLRSSSPGGDRLNPPSSMIPRKPLNSGLSNNRGSNPRLLENVNVAPKAVQRQFKPLSRDQNYRHNPYGPGNIYKTGQQRKNFGGNGSQHHQYLNKSNEISQMAYNILEKSQQSNSRLSGKVSFINQEQPNQLSGDLEYDGVLQQKHALLNRFKEAQQRISGMQSRLPIKSNYQQRFTNTTGGIENLQVNRQDLSSLKSIVQEYTVVKTIMPPAAINK